MLAAFKHHISEHLPQLMSGRLLIANSGGVDSMVLSHLCLKSELDFSLAHCNFNLRGAESNGDEALVIEIAKDWDVPVFTTTFNTKDYADKNSLSTQVAARDLRYNWFKSLLRQHQLDYILTAHHSDDDLETFFINLSRGTGIDGLTGIPEVNGDIIRPLLQFSREEIEVYAIENNLKWRDDSTNASNDYLRNRLRHDVIPTLKNINPRFLQNYKRTRSQLNEAKQILEGHIHEQKKRITTLKEDGSLHFNIEQIHQLKNSKNYIYQLFREYKFKEYNDIYDLLTAQSGKCVYSENYRLLKDRESLILTRKNDDIEEKFFIESDNSEILFPHGKLRFQIVKKADFRKEQIIYVDMSLVEFPLEIRKWSEGDVFYPFGLGGKKKLSKYFKDEKYSVLDKENTWLLCTKKDIIWVIPDRLDDRFKVTESTKTILEISFNEA